MNHAANLRSVSAHDALPDAVQAKGTQCGPLRRGATDSRASLNDLQLCHLEPLPAA